jgi:ankyrin repeat protein
VWFKFNDLPADKAFRSSPVKNGQRESGIMASQTDFFKIMESCEDDMFLYKGYRRRIELNTLRVEAENEIDRHYQKVTFENNNPLIKAVRDRNLEDVKCFLHKELVNVQDYAGDTLLHIAADYGHVDIIYLLLENGYSCSITNNYSYTPLMLAIKNNHNKAAEILIQKSQISQTADNGDTLLHLAARYGNAHTVRILIEKYGFNLKDINSVNNSQQTPLYLACQKGEVEAIKILFKYNADLFIKDNKGKSPLHIAFKRGHEEVILLLTKLILASELLTNQQKITLLQAENKSGCSGFMQTISRCNYTVALSFMALIRNSALSTHEQLQIFQLKNEQEVTLLDKILGEYKEYNSKEAKLQRKEEQKQIYSSKNQEAIRKMQDSPDFNNTKEPLNTMLKILSQLKLDAKLALKVSSMRTISGISRMISLFNKKQEGIITATLNTIHMSPVNQAIKDSLYCAKDLYGAPYLYMALQTSGLDKVKKYLKHIKNYVSIESLNNFMVLDIAKVGSIIHGLLIAVANDPKVLDIFLSELENATAYGLFKEVYDSQMPIVQQRKPISESSLEILKYKSSDEFWNKMEDTLKLLKEKIFQLLFKILVLSS